MPKRNSNIRNQPSDSGGGAADGASGHGDPSRGGPVRGAGTGGSVRGAGTGGSTGGAASDGDANDRRRELLRYAGLSSEVVASIGVAVFLGMKGDKWLKVSFPILSWALPLLVIVVLLVNLIRAGSDKKNGK